MQYEKQFYTLKQVAEILSVNPFTIRREIKRGNLRAMKVGKDYRIDALDLEAYVHARQTDYSGDTSSSDAS